MDVRVAKFKAKSFVIVNIWLTWTLSVQTDDMLHLVYTGILTLQTPLFFILEKELHYTQLMAVLASYVYNLIQFNVWILCKSILKDVGNRMMQEKNQKRFS